VASGWRSALRGAWPAGTALAAALLVQLTLVVLIPLLFAPALFAARAARARALEIAATAALVALALVLPWGVAYHVAGVPHAHYRFGLFQPGLLAMALFAAAGLRAAAAPVSSRVPRRSRWRTGRRSTRSSTRRSSTAARRSRMPCDSPGRNSRGRRRRSIPASPRSPIEGNGPRNSRQRSSANSPMHSRTKVEGTLGYLPRAMNSEGT